MTRTHARGAAPDRKPAVAGHTGADGERERTLRAEHERLAAQDDGREAEQVVGTGSPAVQRDHAGEGAGARRDVGGVKQVHGA